ncbi:hypothetical protein KGM_210610 [Danaus plexippus plexippus]|uniref:Uncharacterized protein n=1 Tax=Danaus plexippus plexippus TaxID=278856 RepID=A0A212FAP7_DANPL|nr:hypothetical protein KGM_210610 [Danaus plexippus plexippus]
MAPTHGAPNIGPTSGVAVARLVKCFCGRCTFNGVPLLLPLSVECLHVLNYKPLASVIQREGLFIECSGCHLIANYGNGACDVAGGAGSVNALPGGTGSRAAPSFDAATPRNVTALVGKSAYLSCRVRNLGNRTVSIKLNFSNTLQYKCLENGIVKSGFNAVYGRPRFEAKIGSRLLDLEEIWQV